MKRLFYIAIAVLAMASCSRTGVISEMHPGAEESEQKEYIEFLANVREDADAASKVDFEYTDKLYNHWDGSEQMDVYIRHANNTYEFAGRIPAVEGTLSADKFSLKFAGDVRRRENPETDTFVMVYNNAGASYDWTKQTLDMRAEAAGTNGLKALKSYSPIVWTFDVETGKYGNMSNKACYIRFAASNLGANVKVKSLSIYNPAGAVFPKTFDLTTFDYQSTNKSKTLSYVFENLSTDNSGNLDIFLAAPIISAGDKSYQIHIVTEDGQHTIRTLSTNGITSNSAMSASKLYKLTRSSFTEATNPATTVGQTQGESGGASNVVIESIVGQWDKTGYLSNDIYGVLEMGKPENLTSSHNAAINAIHKIYNAYFSGNVDTRIHYGAVEVAGKAGQTEGTDLTMSVNGPQYVSSIDNEGTFNNIVLTKETELYMTFIDSKAWNTNTIGYYCYTGETDSKEDAYSSADGHKDVHDLIVFPSTSQSTKGEQLIHKFEAKTTAQLLYPVSTGSFSKKFPAGTTIGLMERVNALEDSQDFALKTISDASPVHYTNIAWNKLNTLSFTEYYWNQIAVLKFKMPEDADFNRHGLIYAMKDKYAAHGSGNNAANWTNPIILIYTSEPDAIDFSRSSDYWTHVVNISEQDATFKLMYDLEGVTSSSGNATITMDASCFTDGKYTTTLNVANAEFGNFSKLSVNIGGRDVTSTVVKSNTGTRAVIEISKSEVCGDVKITAHTSRQIYAQSLTAEQLMTLASEITADGLPQFRLILHSTTASSGNVAFGLDKNGNSYVLPEVQSPIYNANSQHTFDTPTKVTVSDQYNDYEWSIERALDANGNFIGFKLKKVTKYSDTDVRTEGFITRSTEYPVGSYPAVRLTDAGTVLKAEAVGSGYGMRIKSADSSYEYMTCAVGQSLKQAIFISAGNHTNLYGEWLVYKVTLQ